MIDSLNKNRKKGDVALLVMVVLLTIIGAIFIYSASNYSAKSTYNDEYFFVKMIDSSIKYMATKKAYIWNIRNLESGRNLTNKFKKCPVSDL